MTKAEILNWVENILSELNNKMGNPSANFDLMVQIDDMDNGGRITKRYKINRMSYFYDEDDKPQLNIRLTTT